MLLSFDELFLKFVEKQNIKEELYKNTSKEFKIEYFLKHISKFTINTVDIVEIVSKALEEMNLKTLDIPLMYKIENKRESTSVDFLTTTLLPGMENSKYADIGFIPKDKTSNVNYVYEKSLKNTENIISEIEGKIHPKYLKSTTMLKNYVMYLNLLDNMFIENQVKLQIKKSGDDDMFNSYLEAISKEKDAMSYDKMISILQSVFNSSKKTSEDKYLFIKYLTKYAFK
jgi:hypothetical protein